MWGDSVRGVWEFVHTLRQKQGTHIHPAHTPTLRRRNSNLLIPLAFVCPTKAGLQLFLPVELNP